jgi:hypothetical protein
LERWRGERAMTKNIMRTAAVADAADRWFDAGVFQALGVFYGEILGGFN